MAHLGRAYANEDTGFQELVAFFRHLLSTFVAAVVVLVVLAVVAVVVLAVVAVVDLAVVAVVAVVDLAVVCLVADPVCLAAVVDFAAVVV